MEAARVWLLSAVVLAPVLNSGDAISCWVCSSDVDRRCGDPFNMTHLAVTDCDRHRAQSPYLQSMAVCKKTKQRVGNELIIVRSCSWEDEDPGNGPCSPSSVNTYAKTEYCSTCTHDACNSANTLSTIVSLLGAILVSTWLAAE